MLTAKAKLLVFATLILGILLGVWIGMSVQKLQMENNAGTQRAIRVIRITVHPNQQEELFAQLRKFADKWSYATLLDPIAPNGKDFRVAMWREDMKLIGMYPTDPGTLEMGFFATNPTIPVPERYFDEEISDLKTFISEIPGATFSVEKY